METLRTPTAKKLHYVFDTHPAVSRSRINCCGPLGTFFCFLESLALSYPFEDCFFFSVINSPAKLRASPAIVGAEDP